MNNNPRYEKKNNEGEDVQFHRQVDEKNGEGNQSNGHKDKNTENKVPLETDGKKRILKRTGIIMVIVAVLVFVGYYTLIGNTTVDKSEKATEALNTQVSKELPIGTKLMSKDSMLSGRDLSINYTSEVKSTKVWIWDYAAEDGDYVQVKVNGAVLGDPFMIKNKPVELTVPLDEPVVTVEVLGVKDGGGGITYAIYYELDGTTYFNGAGEGESNKYTLTRVSE